MTPREMRHGIPYIVTKGSSWAQLRKGDRVEWCAVPGAMFDSADARVLKVTRKSVEYRHFGASLGSWEVEVDRTGILERATCLRIAADQLEAML